MVAKMMTTNEHWDESQEVAEARRVFAETMTELRSRADEARVMKQSSLNTRIETFLYLKEKGLNLDEIRFITENGYLLDAVMVRTP